MLNKDQKQKAISKVQIHKNDTGSAESQISLLTTRIADLTEHLKTHKKDVHSRRGLLKMVQKRKKLLEFLKNTKEGSYNVVIEKLGLKSN